MEFQLYFFLFLGIILSPVKKEKSLQSLSGSFINLISLGEGQLRPTSYKSYKSYMYKQYNSVKEDKFFLINWLYWDWDKKQVKNEGNQIKLKKL